MRLICPSCGAQYEVDADLIPETGRDVQCSACGHTWFEEPGASAAAEIGGTVAPPVEVAPPRPPAAAPAAEVPPTLAEVPPAPVAPVRAPRRTVTPEIAEILRAEAERERAAREAEAKAGLERQEEMALDVVPAPEPEPVTAEVSTPETVAVAEAAAPEQAEPEPVAVTAEAETPAAHDPVAAAVSEAMSRAAEAAEAAPAAAVEAPVQTPAPAAIAVPAATIRPAEPPQAVAAPARRDRLPDIEEINSTLRPTGERQEPVAAAAQPSSGRGFRMGFSLVLLIAAALAMVYVYAPRIMVAAPSTEPVIRPYVDAVDSTRLWLDLRLQELVDALGSDDAG